MLVRLTENSAIGWTFNREPPAFSMFDMFSPWQEQAEKLEIGEITQEEYDQWRYNCRKTTNRPTKKAFTRSVSPIQ